MCTLVALFSSTMSALARTRLQSGGASKKSAIQGAEKKKTRAIRNPMPRLNQNIVSASSAVRPCLRMSALPNPPAARVPAAVKKMAVSPMSPISSLLSRRASTMLYTSVTGCRVHFCSSIHRMPSAVSRVMRDILSE